MRVLYYTYPWYFDASLCFIRAMSKKVELHVIMEVAPESRKGVVCDLTAVPLRAGLTPADEILNTILPEAVRAYWKNTSSFYLSVFTNIKSLHPHTIRQGWEFAKHVKAIDPDFIYFEDPILRVALWSIFLRDIPSTISVHDPMPHSGEHNWRTTLSRKLMYGVSKHFILHNETQRKGFVNEFHLSSKITSVIQLGAYDVYPDLISEIPSSTKNSVLFFGRISPYKGLSVLFEAAICVSEQVENVTFSIVGKPVPGYQIPDVPKLMNGCKFDIYSEYVSTAVLGNYFRQATCVVCPYLDSTQSGVILTAYAFNKPVIATNTGGIPEYVKDRETGFLVEVRNPKALADAIILLLENQQLQAKLENGVALIKKNSLSWETIANEHITSFEKMIKN